MIHLRSTRKLCNSLKEATGFSPFDHLHRACTSILSLNDALPASSTNIPARFMVSSAYKSEWPLEGIEHRTFGLPLAVRLSEVRFCRNWFFKDSFSRLHSSHKCPLCR